MKRTTARQPALFSAACWLAVAATGWAAETNPPSPLQIAPPGGLFVTNPIVSISGPTNEIRYTLDGSAPQTNSARYAAPLIISNSCYFQARGFVAGQPTGALAAASFIMADTNLAGFRSSLPLVCVETFGHSIAAAETNLMTSIRVVDGTEAQQAAPDGAANFEGRASLKVRGYTSRRYPKHSLSMELRDAADEPRHAALLGMPADSDWVLYAPYPDKSLIRDVLAYNLSQEMGHYASRTRFVEVFVNDSTGRLARAHYAGVYVLEEKVDRKS